MKEAAEQSLSVLLDYYGDPAFGYAAQRERWVQQVQKVRQALSEQTERDTHFAGFARLLWDEFENLGHRLPLDFNFTPDNWTREVQKIIARRAYDLMAHAIEYIKPEVYEGHSATWESAGDIPDMTTWPESEK